MHLQKQTELSGRELTLTKQKKKKKETAYLNMQVPTLEIINLKTSGKHEITKTNKTQ